MVDIDRSRDHSTVFENILDKISLFPQGTDITEAFETYHIRSIAAQVLPKYYIREAAKPRNYKLTYEDDGFFRTLKRRVAEKYQNLDKSSMWKSKLYLDLDVIVMFIAATLAARASNFMLKLVLSLIAAQCAGWLNTLSHNFTHQRDNWRLYSSNLILIGWKDWRTYHGLVSSVTVGISNIIFNFCFF